MIQNVIILGGGYAGPPGFVADQPVEGLDLEIKQIGNLKRLVDLREGDPTAG